MLKVIALIALSLASWAATPSVLAQEPAPEGIKPNQAVITGDPDMGDVEELVKRKQKEQAAFGAMNAANPLAPHDVATGAAPVPGQPPALSIGDIPPNNPGLEKFQTLLKNPAFAKFAGTMSVAVQDPEFMKAANGMIKNPNMKWVYIVLLIYTFMFWVLKRRALASTDRFLPKLIIRLTFFVTFLFGYFAVGFAILGQPFVKVLTVIGGAAYHAFL